VKILVSACILGQPVRYDGGHALVGDRLLARWREEGRIVSFCPECAAGLPVPRPPAEISQGRVVDAKGVDWNDAFEKGARMALELCLDQGITVAVLKENSPSCGSERIYDGSFSGRTVEGMGRTAELLKRHGIRVFSEKQLQAAAVIIEAPQYDEQEVTG